jgi:Na+-transporting methylmalonyl-CoA/oxaloacetate decarboxylase gamma subunit
VVTIVLIGYTILLVVFIILFVLLLVWRGRPQPERRRDFKPPLKEDEMKWHPEGYYYKSPYNSER